MTSHRERNDRRPRFSKPSGARPEGRGGEPETRGPQRRGPPKPDPDGWLWGRHAVEAALTNPAREGQMRLVATEERLRALQPILRGRPDLRPETLDAHEIGRLLPQGAVHQGLALRAPPLEGVGLEDLAESGVRVLVMLDQITDPQNVGAVFRSAAAFGAGVVLQDRNTPPLGGVLAKAAAGGIDKAPFARVVNLSRALETLSDLGFRAVGLAGEAQETLEETLDARRVVLVLGSEGEGLRRLVAEHCDALARIPMPGGFESLNVAAAAAVALYEATRPGRR